MRHFQLSEEKMTNAQNRTVVIDCAISISAGTSSREQHEIWAPGDAYFCVELASFLFVYLLVCFFFLNPLSCFLNGCFLNGPQLGLRSQSIYPSSTFIDYVATCNMRQTKSHEKLGRITLVPEVSLERDSRRR